MKLQAIANSRLFFNYCMFDILNPPHSIANGADFHMYETTEIIA